MVQTVCQTSNCCINYTRLDKIADLVKRIGKKIWTQIQDLFKKTTFAGPGSYCFERKQSVDVTDT